MRPFAATKFSLYARRTWGSFGLGLVYKSPTNAINLLWDSLDLTIGPCVVCLTRYRFFW